jgi:hypothetical protein
MNKPRHTRAQIAKADTIEKLLALGYNIGFVMRVIEARQRKIRGY